MGTTVSSLQILGVPEEAVRDALPHALVGQWSARFVTACLDDLFFQQLDRKAGALSKKLACTVLSVSMFDGDALTLSVYRNGKFLTQHVVNPESGENIAGNPKLFCTALGIPEELAPKLKRLFVACEMQEEKLDIFQALLGAPLFLRYGDEKGLLPEKPVEADSGPLEKWVGEHPEPPKIKNQCKAELTQEISDRVFSVNDGGDAWIAKRVNRTDEEEARLFGCKVGDVVGETLDVFWVRVLPDGQLDLIPLPPTWNGAFSCMGDRLVTAQNCILQSVPSKHQTVMIHDSAGILPCPIPLIVGKFPATIYQLRLLSDGGFVVAIQRGCDELRPSVRLWNDLLACYGPDGVQRWTVPDAIRFCAEIDGTVYVEAYREERRLPSLLALDMDGTVMHQCALPNYSHGSEVYFLNGIPYILESVDRQTEDLLCRLTPDLRPNGEVPVPDMPAQLSYLCLSPDNTLLYAVGYESSLRVIDAQTLSVIRDLPKKCRFRAAATDSQNRLWVGTGSYAECYTPSLELVSRHRLKGEVTNLYRNEAGQVCAATFQEKTYMIRVYRFT